MNPILNLETPSYAEQTTHVATSSAQPVEVKQERTWTQIETPADYRGELPVSEIEAAAVRAVTEHARALDILSR